MSGERSKICRFDDKICRFVGDAQKQTNKIFSPMINSQLKLLQKASMVVLLFMNILNIL